MWGLGSSSLESLSDCSDLEKLSSGASRFPRNLRSVPGCIGQAGKYTSPPTWEIIISAMHPFVLVFFFEIAPHTCGISWLTAFDQLCWAVGAGGVDVSLVWSHSRWHLLRGIKVTGRLEVVCSFIFKIVLGFRVYGLGSRVQA